LVDILSSLPPEITRRRAMRFETLRSFALPIPSAWRSLPPAIPPELVEEVGARDTAAAVAVEALALGGGDLLERREDPPPKGELLLEEDEGEAEVDAEREAVERHLGEAELGRGGTCGRAGHWLLLGSGFRLSKLQSTATTPV
jgi:hypothetical protein